MARHADENSTAVGRVSLGHEKRRKDSRNSSGTPPCYYFRLGRFPDSGFSSAALRALARPALASVLLLPPTVAPEARGFQQNAAESNSRNSGFDALAESARTAREQGRVEEAREYYRRALDKRPDWTEGWWYLGTMAYDRNDYADAIASFQKVLALRPELSGGWTFLGLCEYAEKNYENALAHLEKGDALGRSGDSELDRVADFHLALLRIRQGAFAEGARLIARDFSQPGIPAQAQFALGLAMLRIPLLPEEIAPSKEGTVEEAGRLAAETFSGGAWNFLDAFPALLAKYPRAPYLHYAHGEWLEANSREKEAIAAFRREVEISPQGELSRATPQGVFPPARAVQEQVNEGLKRYYGNPGDEGSTNALAGDPWNLAIRDFSLHKYDEAIRDLTAVVRARPNFGTAWAMLGLSEFALKQYDNARIHLEKGQEFGLGGSADSVRDARYHLALLLIRDGEFERATSELVRDTESSAPERETRFALGLALLRLPHLPEEIPERDRAMVDQAGEVSSLLYESKYDLALPKLELLLRQHPETPFLHYAYGNALSSLSEFREAQQEFIRETRISPKSRFPYLGLASVALKLKHPEEALPFAERAVELAPRSAEAHFYLGRCYLELEKPQEAVRELAIAAKLLPGSPDVHFQLARAYAKAKETEKAAAERETFERLNALAEKRRSFEGNQAYGAAHAGSDLRSPEVPPNAAESKPPQ